MFLIDGSLNPTTYLTNLGFDLTTGKVYELEMLDPSPKIINADLNLLNCNSSPLIQLRQNAIDYWKGTSIINDNTETLFEGRFKILS